MGTLSYDEVLAIHERVIIDFAEDVEDPVGLAGPRDEGRLLESVIFRQEVGLGDVLKHPTPYGNAATLTFGICCGHPFHNGNKRTALVAMLAHLDRNRLTVFGVRKKELYGLMKSVATHTLGVRPDPRNKRRDYTDREVDEEVAAIATWLRKNARPVKRDERHITSRQLRQILTHDGFTLESTKNMGVGICKEVPVKRGLLRKTTTQKTRVATIAWPGDGRVVGINQIKGIRRATGLVEANGCDSTSFYERADMVDVFVDEYRDILRKLARE